MPSLRRLDLARLALASLVAACASAGPPGSPVAPTPGIVRVRGGLVSGVATDRPGVHAYLGIPFAAPPVGDLRWRAPRAVGSWSGVRAADRFAPSCMQGPPVPFGPWTTEFLLRGPVSEDCLYLNVWTAAGPGERRPVFVYIYGGGFGSGSGDVPVYDGARLAEQGLVVLTINYRVGSLGFLAHPALTAEAGASGNYGLLDQIEALRWVRENVDAFGGDARRVTIAGQSAGAMSVFLLTASPLAKGLFQRAIMQSGPGGLAAFGIARASDAAPPRAAAEREGERWAAAKGAPSLAAMRALPADSFVAGGPVRFGPVIDGRAIVEDPALTFAAGRQNDVATISGLNADENNTAPGAVRITAAQFREQATRRYGERASAFLALYPSGTDEEARRSQTESGREAGVAGLERLLRERAVRARTPAFAYYFDRVIPWPEHPEFGAFHTSEVPYVFGTLDMLQRPWTDTDRRLSATMMRYWVNFATTGDPNGQALPPWPAFDPARPILLRLGDTVGPREPVAPARLEFLAR